MSRRRCAPVPLTNAMSALRAGEVVVLVDDITGSNQTSLVIAGEHASAPRLAFMIRHSSGFICAAMPTIDCERLDLPPMTWRAHGRDQDQRVSVDHQSSGTGISGRDRARTIAALANPTTAPSDLIRPGHVIPVAVPAHTPPGPASLEHVAVALLQLSRLRAVAGIAALVDAADPTHIADGPAATAFAIRHRLTLLQASAVHPQRPTCSTTRSNPTAGSETRTTRTAVGRNTSVR